MCWSDAFLDVWSSAYRRHGGRTEAGTPKPGPSKGGTPSPLWRRLGRAPHFHSGTGNSERKRAPPLPLPRTLAPDDPIQALNNPSAQARSAAPPAKPHRRSADCLICCFAGCPPSVVALLPRMERTGRACRLPIPDAPTVNPCLTPPTRVRVSIHRRRRTGPIDGVDPAYVFTANNEATDDKGGTQRRISRWGS